MPSDPHPVPALGPAEAAFLSGFKSSGGSLHPSCALALYGDMGRGMVATDAIDEDELLFSIPRSALLGTRTSQLPRLCLGANDGHQPADASLAQAWNDLSKGGWTQLMLLLMWEAFRASRPDALAELGRLGYPGYDGAQADWGWYLGILPSHFETPMFWSAEELAELKGTSIVDKIGKEEATASYTDLVLPLIRSHPKLFLGSLVEGREVGSPELEELLQRFYSLDLFHVMGSRVLSRSFHVKRPEECEADDDDEGEGEAKDDVDMDASEGAAQAAGHGEEGAEADEGGAEQLPEEADEDHDDDDDDDDDDEEEEQERLEDVNMVPMADMLNARYGSDNARLFYRPDRLEMRATRRIERGEQVWNTYGDPPGSDLLRRYGHVDERNGADVVEVSLDDVVRAVKELRSSAEGDAGQRDLAMDGGAAEDGELRERVKWMVNEGLDDVFGLTHLYPLEEAPPYRSELQAALAKAQSGNDDDDEADKLLSVKSLLRRASDEESGVEEGLVVAVRLVTMSRASFDRARRKGRMPSARLDVVEGGEADEELQALATARVLQRACELRLRDYETCIEEDEELLGSNALQHASSRRRMAVIVRLGEKRVLRDHIEVLRRIADEVQRRRDEDLAGKADKSGKRKGGDKEGAGKKAVRK